MTTHPVRLDRMQAGLVASIEAALAGGWGSPWGSPWGGAPEALVLWAPSEYPTPAAGRQQVVIKPISGPSTNPLGGVSVRSWRVPMSVLVTIDDPIEGAGIRLEVSGMRWEYTIPPGATVTSVRDELLDLIGEDPDVSATFTAMFADSIEIEAHAPGDLYGVRVRQSAAVASVETTTTELVEAAIGSERTLINVEAFAADRYMRGGALSLLTRWIKVQPLSAPRELLCEYGLALDISAPTSLDHMAGPGWSSRAVVPVYVSQVSLAALPIEPIDQAGLGLAIHGAGPAPAALPIEVDPS